MNAKLLSMFSVEIDSALEHFVPEDKGNFGALIRLMVGADGTAGSESFDLFVCTPDWIKAHCTGHSTMWGHGMLVVSEFIYEDIREEVEKLLANCAGLDWNEVAAKIGRYASWEFEDYKR